MKIMWRHLSDKLFCFITVTSRGPVLSSYMSHLIKTFPYLSFNSHLSCLFCLLIILDLNSLIQ